MAEYVSIADGVEGYAYYDQDTNELVTLDTDQPGSAQVSLRPATAQEIEGARRGFAARGLSQKALGLGEAAVSGATFGLATSDSPEAKARAQVLGQENPILKTGAKLAGTLAPALLTGGAVGAVGAAAGLGGRALGVATFAGEELAQAAAFELSEAAELDRSVEIGNIAQGLLEGAAFLGVGRFAGKLFRRGEDAAQAAAKAPGAGPADALARGQAKAAEAGKFELKTPTKREAQHYVQNRDEIHNEVNELGYEIGNRMFGRDGSFSRAHSVQYKKTDILGKMKDADGDAIVDTLEEMAEQAEALAVKMEDASHAGVPNRAASRSIRAQAQQLRAARAGVQVDAALGKARGGAEDAALALDGFKRHLDDLRGKFGGHATKATDPLRKNVDLIDEVVEPARERLMDAKVWGKNWAEKQRGENAIWSGADGIITQRSYWQAELMERAPGAASTYRTKWGDLPVFQMHGDMVERVLALNPRKQRQVIEAMEKDLAGTQKMAEIKAAIGGPDTRAAVAEVQQHITEFKDALTEIKRMVQLDHVWGAYMRKIGDKTLGEELLDSVPLAGPLATRGLRKLRNEMTPEGVERTKAIAVDELRKRIASRQDMRKAGKFDQDGRKLTAEALKAAGKKVVSAGKETLLEAAGGTAAAGGAVGLAALAAETQAIREIDQHGKDTTERAMLALASPDAELMTLPDIAERFQGDFPDLSTAYQARMGDLRKLAEDPEEFIARVTEAFEPLATAGHPEVAAKLITRMQIGIRYLLENAPPTLGTSMFEPEGSPPDEIAVLQFAPVWEAVWHPLDTVRDVAARNATPSAVRALREVHPDVYSRLMSESFRTLAQAGPEVDFETKRYLDNVFGFGAAVGRSFSPQFSNLLATARQDTKQSRPSLGGESVVAPESSTVGFSQGPTAIR